MESGTDRLIQYHQSLLDRCNQAVSTIRDAYDPGAMAGLVSLIEELATLSIFDDQLWIGTCEVRTQLHIALMLPLMMYGEVDRAQQQIAPLDDLLRRTMLRRLEDPYRTEWSTGDVRLQYGDYADRTETGMSALVEDGMSAVMSELGVDRATAVSAASQVCVAYARWGSWYAKCMSEVLIDDVATTLADRADFHPSMILAALSYYGSMGIVALNNVWQALDPGRFHDDLVATVNDGEFVGSFLMSGMGAPVPVSKVQAVARAVASAALEAGTPMEVAETEQYQVTEDYEETETYHEAETRQVKKMFGGTKDKTVMVAKQRPVTRQRTITRERPTGHGYWFTGVDNLVENVVDSQIGKNERILQRLMLRHDGELFLEFDPSGAISFKLLTDADKQRRYWPQGETKIVGFIHSRMHDDPYPTFKFNERPDGSGFSRAWTGELARSAGDVSRDIINALETVSGTA